MKSKRIIGANLDGNRGKVYFQLENGIYAEVPVGEEGMVLLWPTFLEAFNPLDYSGRFEVVDMEELPSEVVRDATARLRKEPESRRYKDCGEEREKMAEDDENDWVKNEEQYIALAKTGGFWK